MIYVFEEARALEITMKMRKMSQKEMAKSLGVSQSYVANKLRLLKLEPKMQEQILKYHLSERHARALLRLDDADARQTVLDRVCNEGLSVARTEALIDFYHVAFSHNKIGRAEELKYIDAFIDSITNSLSILSSTGLSARKKISYENDKVFISICINNR